MPGGNIINNIANAIGGFTGLASNFGALNDLGGINSNVTIGNKGRVPYYEVMEDRGESSGQFLYGNSTCTQTILVDFFNVSLAYQDILGVDTTQNGKINRTPPVCHPMHPMLRAVSCSAPKGYRAAGGYQAGGIPYSQAQGSWLFAFITITFAALPVNSWQDGIVADESSRYCILNPLTPTFDVIQGKAGTMQYAEAGATGSIPFGLTIPQQKGDLVIKWLRVPDDYVLSNNRAIQFENCVGCVNSDFEVNGKKFLGSYNDGELLCLAPRFTANVAPYAVLNQNAFPTFSRSWDIDLVFKDFNVTSATGAYFGHNTVINPSDRKYYLATSKGGVNDPRLFKRVPFSSLFSSATAAVPAQV